MNVPMVEVQAPSHIMRKSGYSNALNMRRSTAARGLREGVGSLDEMEDVAIAVTEKHETVALVYIRFGQELNSARSQLFVGRVEILDRDGEVANSRVFH